MRERETGGQATVAELIRAYADGFDDYDADAIVNCYAFPCVIWQLGAGHVFADADELMENVDALLGVFGEADILRSQVEIADEHLAGDTAHVTLAWRQEDADGEPVLEFVCDYTLLRRDGGWGIVLAVNRDDGA